MPIAVYTKANPVPPLAPQSQSRGIGRHLLRLLPPALIAAGSILIVNVIWPLLHYQLFLSPSLAQDRLVTPIDINQTAFITPDSPAQAPPVSAQDTDFTKPNTWFPAADFQLPRPSKITHYTISIPSLDIEEAVVAIGGDDLSESLIHYPGTANPGQLGSPVIFGHSVLRQFYNPDQDNPKRYVSIFSKIMTLKTGDEILVDYDGIRYRYVVNDKFEVKPQDVYILAQRYNNRQLKLVTCVPEGTYLRRGVIVAQLQDLAHER